MKKSKKEKGITLIALTITIVVLLILAGVTIAAISGDNGILQNAARAKEETDKANDIEKIKLAISDAQIGNAKYQKLDFQNFQKALNSQFGENRAIVSLEEDGIYTVDCFDTLKTYAFSGNDIKETIDWNEKMASAVVPERQTNKNVIGIGTDGNPVNMDLWKYTPDEEAGGYVLNSEEAINNSERIAGYRGKVEDDGTIEGTVPQYIKENNGKWLPVTSLYHTFQGHDETTNRELRKLTTAPKIPPTVVNMAMAFEYCERLTNIFCIPGSVKELKWAFDGYTALEEMPKIGYGVENMTGTFSGCSELKKLSVLPDSIENMNRTFSGCSSLKEVPNIPISVTNMNGTFYECTGLGYVEITIPENVVNITQTFANCINLEGIITINCNPENYINFLQNTTRKIILTGDSAMLNQIREARSNVTVVEE